MDTDNRRQALFGETVKELRATCKSNKYRGYSKLCKKSLIEHIISWEQAGEKEEMEECPICFEPHEAPSTVTMKCRHSLCFDCFVTHARTSNTCPLCRAEFAARLQPQPQIDRINEILVNAMIDNTFQAHFNAYHNAQLNPHLYDLQGRNTVWLGREARIDRVLVSTMMKNLAGQMSNWYVPDSRRRVPVNVVAL